MTKNTKTHKTQTFALYKIAKKKKEMEIFAFCVITFEPIISKTCHAPQNDRQNISFVKDEQTYGKKNCQKRLYKGHL